MTIEMFLAIASLAISLGGLATGLIHQQQKRIVILTVVVSALTITSSIAFYQLYQYEQELNRVEDEILVKLCGHTWTFDHLYDQLFYKAYPLVNEALFRAVERGAITHKIYEFRGFRDLENKSLPENKFLKVKGYYVTSGCNES